MAKPSDKAKKHARRPQMSLFDEAAREGTKLTPAVRATAEPPRAADPAPEPSGLDDEPAPPARAAAPRRATAESMAQKQREISVAEFFTKNRHLLGFDNPRKALLTCVKEAV